MNLVTQITGTRIFIATAPPAGSLPIEVPVRAGTRRWTVPIAAGAHC
jgi:hypothetical protein